MRQSYQNWFGLSMGNARFELAASALSARCSTTELISQGGFGRARTDDLQVKSPLLYQLSYKPKRRMLDSNQRRYYPHGLANRCIDRSANPPREEPQYISPWGSRQPIQHRFSFLHQAVFVPHCRLVLSQHT